MDSTMSDKLRDAIEYIQDRIDNKELIDYIDDVEMKLVLDAAWRYWDQAYAEGDPWDE